MAVTFVTADFYTDISQKEFLALTQALYVGGDPDPAANAILRAQQIIDVYAGRHALPVDMEKRLISSIGIFEVVSRVGQIEDKRQKAYDEAMKTLREIRDGKFEGLIDRVPIPAILSPTVGGYGSASRINTSRFGTTQPELN